MSTEIDFPELDEAMADARPVEPAPQAAEQPAPTSTALALIVKTDVVEFSATEKGLIALHQRLHNIAYPALATVKGMGQAIADRRELRDLRIGVARMAKDLNAKDHTEYEARRDKRLEGVEKITGIVEALEKPIDEQIKAEDARKEKARLEKKRIEDERLAHHRGELAKIASYPDQARGQPAEKIAGAIEFVRSLTFGPEWEDFCDDAAEARDAAVAKLTAMHSAAVAQEAEAARLEAQRVENARVAAEQAETQRKLDEQAAELKQRQDDIDRAEREAQEKRDAELQAKATELHAENVQAAAPALTTTTPELDNPLVNQAAEPIAEAPAPAPVVEAVTQVYAPTPASRTTRVAARRPAPKSVDIATPAELRTEWAEFEFEVTPYLPDNIDFTSEAAARRFATALERIRAVFA